MKNLESIYIKILSSTIEYYHTELNYIDPRLINKAKFYTRALFILHSYVAKHLDNAENLSINRIQEFMKNRFGTKNYFSFLIDLIEREILALFDNENIPVYDIPLGTLYETLLNFETSGLEIKTGKEYRNKLGSYYTPKEYAEEITKITFQTYLKQINKTSVLNAKCVDFSCGCGMFLLSALAFLKNNIISNEELRNIALNFYACDVDPIALEIAKISVLDFCNASDFYDEISKNFQHANFLVHSNVTASLEDKLQAAMEGYIYHQNLAINTSFLQKYDIILGNPPWEKIRFEEKKFYSQYIDQIAYINFKFELSSSIEEVLNNNPYIREYSESYIYQLELAKQSLKHSTFFKDSIKGELNTCNLFTDAAFNLVSEHGCVGLFVKSSSLTSKANQSLYSKLSKKIIAVYDFINRRKIFQIDSRERFAILILGNRNIEEIHLGMNLLSLDEINVRSELVPINIFEVINPETKMIPNLNSGKDLKILTELYNRFQIFSKIFPDAKYGRLVHFTNHINDIEKEAKEDNIPIFEGKFFSLFDNAFSGFNNVPEEDRYKSKALSKKLSSEEKEAGLKPVCRFYIRKDKWESLSKDYTSDYMVAWRSLTSSTNVRSCIATLLPFIPGSQSIQFLTLKDTEAMIFLVGILNSIVYDYIVKCKLNGIDLTQAIISQIPFPSYEYSNSVQINIKGKTTTAYKIIIDIVKEFYKNDNWVKAAFTNKTNNKLEITELRSLFVLLDAVVAKLYGLSKEEFKYIISYFDKFYTQQERQSLIEQYEAINR